jgi:hypothetical protein
MSKARQTTVNRLAIKKLGNKPQALVHYRTLLSRHPHLPLPEEKPQV